MRRCLRVAPHAGAWIETQVSALIRPISAVASHAGAWIETAHYRVTGA